MASSTPTTKLTIFLLKDGSVDFEVLSQCAVLPWDSAYRRLESINNPGYDICAFIDPGTLSPPRWLNFIKDHFETDGFDLQNRRCSLILFVAIEEKVLAVTFGSAFHLIDRGMIVPRFGLMTTLNNLHASKIETVDTGNLDSPSKQKRTHITQGRSIHEHDIDRAIDWIRNISGKPSKQNGITRYLGSDSLGIVCKISLDDLGATCTSLIRECEEKNYKENFSFVDHIIPLKDAELCKYLDTITYQLLTGKDTTSGRLEIAFPDVEYSSAVRFQMSYKRKPLAYDELTLPAVSAYLRFLGAENSDDTLIDTISVSPLDADGGAIARDRLRDYIVAQIEYDDRKFIHSYGNWFEADLDYLTQVEKRVNRITDLTDTFELPAFSADDTEDSYNKRLAAERGWLLLDKKNITLQSYDRAEPCDILTKEGTFICIKNLARSAQMSHLFAQASVSASLLREHQPFFNQVAAQYKEKWPGEELSRDKLIFVLGIATDKELGVADSLPFFSAINLLNHERKIRLSGYELGLCKIQVPSKTPIGKRRPRKSRQQALQ